MWATCAPTQMNRPIVYTNTCVCMVCIHKIGSHTHPWPTHGAANLCPSCSKERKGSSPNPTTPSLGSTCANKPKGGGRLDLVSANRGARLRGGGDRACALTYLSPKPMLALQRTDGRRPRCLRAVQRRSGAGTVGLWPWQPKTG